MLKADIFPKVVAKGHFGDRNICEDQSAKRCIVEIYPVKRDVDKKDLLEGCVVEIAIGDSDVDKPEFSEDRVVELAVDESNVLPCAVVKLKIFLLAAAEPHIYQAIQISQGYVGV